MPSVVRGRSCKILSSEMSHVSVAEAEATRSRARATARHLSRRPSTDAAVGVVLGAEQPTPPTASEDLKLDAAIAHALDVLEVDPRAPPGAQLADSSATPSPGESLVTWGPPDDAVLEGAGVPQEKRALIAKHYSYATSIGYLSSETQMRKVNLLLPAKGQPSLVGQLSQRRPFLAKSSPAAHGDWQLQLYAGRGLVPNTCGSRVSLATGATLVVPRDVREAAFGLVEGDALWQRMLEAAAVIASTSGLDPSTVMAGLYSTSGCLLTLGDSNKVTALSILWTYIGKGEACVQQRGLLAHRSNGRRGLRRFVRLVSLRFCVTTIAMRLHVR